MNQTVEMLLVCIVLFCGIIAAGWAAEQTLKNQQHVHTYQESNQ